MSRIKGVLIKNGSVKEYDFDCKSYKDFYELLNIDCFDVVQRRFNDSVLDVYCDDEALLKKELPLVSIAKIDKLGNVVDCIYGNVFICNHDSIGETISLTDKEVCDVLKNRIILKDTVTNKMYNAVRS